MLMSHDFKEVKAIQTRTLASPEKETAAVRENTGTAPSELRGLPLFTV